MNIMSEIAPLISDLAVILIAAGIITLIFKCLKQPVVLGYIVAGILAGPAVPYIPTVSDPTNIKIWADIGVIFLLFAMGLEFSFKKLMTVGGTAVIASITIVSGMMFLGYTAGNALGFSHLSSIFLGGMLSMSSTAIVFKAFDDMGLRGQKFTGVVLGVLVGEDLVAVVLMVLLSTLAVSKQVEGMEMLESILKLGAFLIFWSLLGIYLIPSFLKKIKPFLNDETFFCSVHNKHLFQKLNISFAAFTPHTIQFHFQSDCNVLNKICNRLCTLITVWVFQQYHSAYDKSRLPDADAVLLLFSPRP